MSVNGAEDKFRLFVISHCLLFGRMKIWNTQEEDTVFNIAFVMFSFSKIHYKLSILLQSLCIETACFSF